jgi:hypothetical protein
MHIQKNYSTMKRGKKSGEEEGILYVMGARIVENSHPE